MPNPYFEFFELIAEELNHVKSRVLTRKDLEADGHHSSLLDDLKEIADCLTTEDAIQKAVDYLSEHFRSRNADLPFGYDPHTGRFSAIDPDFLAFVVQIKSIRSVGKKSKDFEVSVLERLKLRTTGSLHRVGHPRETHKAHSDFNHYLRQKLGFDGKVLFGKEKDGGLDILWLLPVGALPHSPLVAVQCKNGTFNLAEADQSNASGRRSLDRHRGLMSQVHVQCVLFNDYIYPEALKQPKRLDFVPLGLSDLIKPLAGVVAFAI